ncbi:Ku protein [Horticoccus luteus]|uniref:Non-homologous end joining protein Ku n=1 Tax=Horticoccus luteus TaxID=2862869 RepID=A0A8F9XM27_9BACT|nr:Ku protein [Horticoccus luteus]QYM79826.1 Ku protein [Horticoccus luteus]
MRSIWKGSISFGLVNVPVALYPATRYEEIKFRLLRATDLSPINYKRVAEVDGREVPWDEIVKGYEYEKGKFVVLKDADFKRVDIEATQTIDIADFVELQEVNPIYFHKPYYLEPQRGADRVYGLLRDVLKSSGKAGIAKVVIRSRQHLAALKANGDALVLELMHFADEIVSDEELKIPQSAKVNRREFDMASSLVERMTAKWDPARYADDYRSALLHLIDEKVASGGKASPPAPKKPSHRGKVIDLMAVLQESLEHASRRTAGKRTKKPAKAPRKRHSRKKAA